MSTFRTLLEAKELKGKNGDVSVSWTSLAYGPEVKIVKSKEILEFFSEDNGFDQYDANTIDGLKAGEVHRMGDMKIGEVVAVKL